MQVKIQKENASVPEIVEQNNVTVSNNEWNTFSVSVRTVFIFRIIITFFGDGVSLTRPTGRIINTNYSLQPCPSLTTPALLTISSTPTNQDASSSIAGAIAAAVVVFVVLVIVLIVVIVLYRRGKLQFLKTLP
jgi:hypothetical protein